MIEVLEPGLLTTVQDLGRPGLAHLGVPPSGAADRVSLSAANRLVGNHDGDAALEATLVGPTLRFLTGALLAITGGTVAARLGGRPVGTGIVLRASAGEILEVGAVHTGVRTYVAVAGGVAVEPVLGSRSHDLLTGLGPPPLAHGQILALGAPAGRPGARALSYALPAVTALRIVPGPRDDWFTDEARRALVGEAYTATSASNRVGVRLHGPPLERAIDEELLSEGLVTGALQVPPSGQPILLLQDHPTTGGYPVIAVVVAEDIPVAGQLRPGTAVRFRLAG
jgi:biotin-dependent carboxylase-like uncharacterized protein